MNQKRKQQHFLELYEPVHDSFERFCRARVFGQSDHRDLMNDTLLVAYGKFDELKDKKAFLSFLIGTSIRILANEHRKKKETNASHESFAVPDASAKTDRDAEVYLLHRAMALLPNEQRECLIMFEITGFSIKEISQLQGASESAVKQRLRRGRTRLVEILSFESTQKTREVKNGTE